MLKRRRIMFRAWDKFEKEMMYNLNDSVEVYHRAIDGELLCGRYNDDGRYYLIELNQYTGRNDTRGYPIFEMDIVWMIDQQCYAVVEFDNYVGTWIVKDNESDTLPLNKCQVTVVGNVYNDYSLLNY